MEGLNLGIRKIQGVKWENNVLFIKGIYYLIVLGGWVSDSFICFCELVGKNCVIDEE